MEVNITTIQLNDVSFHNQESIDEEVKEPPKTTKRKKKKPEFIFNIDGVKG